MASDICVDSVPLFLRSTMCTIEYVSVVTYCYRVSGS